MGSIRVGVSPVSRVAAPSGLLHPLGFSFGADNKHIRMSESLVTRFSNKWTEEQKASLVEALKPFEKGEGLVNWKAARDAGVVPRIEQEFQRPEKTIKAYYNNQFRRAHWNLGSTKKKGLRGKYKPRKVALMKEVEPAMNPAPKPVKALKFCPSCGENLMAYHAAANLNHG